MTKKETKQIITNTFSTSPMMINHFDFGLYLTIDQMMPLYSWQTTNIIQRSMHNWSIKRILPIKAMWFDAIGYGKKRVPAYNYKTNKKYLRIKAWHIKKQSIFLPKWE